MKTSHHPVPPPVPFTAARLAELLGGEIVGDPSVNLTGFASAGNAREGDLTFAETEAYLAAAEESRATAILVGPIACHSSKTLIRVPNPRVAVARVLPLFFPPEAAPAGIDPTAVVDPGAGIDPTAHVGPHCRIEAGVRVGARSVLMGGNHLGRDVEIGEECRLFPNVVVYPGSRIGDRVAIHAGSVIGSDGYGYVLDEGRHRKLLQLGNVIIGNDVEIGANCAIDRGALGSTVVGEGTKIDNLVHLAHNVVLGRHCIITGQVGFGGSTRMGDYCVVAAQAGIADHLQIGHQVTIGAKSGVMRDIPDGGRVWGIPASPHHQAKRQMIAVQHAPEMLRRLRELERQLEELLTSTPCH